MKVKAARFYGKNDLRLDTFDLREIEPDEVLAKVICDSVCMSSYKTLQRGKPPCLYPVGNEGAPTVVGHELAAEIVQVGEAVKDKYKVGDKFGVQAAMVIKGKGMAPGYHFSEFGGSSTYVIVPPDVLPSKFMIWFDDMPFFRASLGEPYACLLFALYGNFHTTRNTRGFEQGIKQGGAMAIMGGCGPMGFGMVELALNMDKRPGTLIVTDVDQARIDHAAKVISPEYAAEKGVKLQYVNTASMADPVAELRALTGERGEGFDDIYIMCPIQSVIELADKVCNYSCCINFFSGPVDTGLSASINFHEVHYKAKHIVGSASSGVIDMKEVFEMASQGRLRPEVMITHVGGLNCAVETISNLPKVPGGKKLLYSNIDMELTAIEDFCKKDDPLSKGLAEICGRHNMLWSAEAEEYLLKNGKSIMD